MVDSGNSARRRLGLVALQDRVDGMFPDEFRTHVRGMRREFWLAVRSLIDTRIAACEAEDKPRSRQANRVPVE